MKKTLTITILALLLIVNIGVTGFFQWPLQPNIKANVKELDQYLTEQKFNGSVLVGYQGEIIFEKGYGYQDKENGVKNTEDTAFLVGSITKQFTAAAILQLQEQGKLRVSDTLDHYFPDYPNSENITIQQLLTHQAGLPEYLGLYEEADYGKEFTVDQLLEKIRVASVKSQPGKKFQYNNTGYNLLGGIIEKVSGQSYENYLNEHIFKPAGMKQSAFGFDADKQPERAVGYLNEDFEKAPFIHPSFAYAGGAISSTLGDLFLWDRALAGDKILSEKSKQDMFQSHTNETLMPNQAYGYGMYIVEEGKSMYHPGFIDGFSSNIFRNTENDLVIIGLSNKGDSMHSMLPAILYDFSENLEQSWNGYSAKILLYLLLAVNVFVLVRWIVCLDQGKRTLKPARWYQVAFQTVLLGFISLVLLVIPFAPNFAHELFSSQRLMFVAVPIWKTAVNLVVVISTLAIIGAIQPFIKKEKAAIPWNQAAPGR
ncbi:serine hydrolase [Bacillus sp. FJAT-29814]|uniref:serine hydrolase domain-containing protein n=1 Tax=Bacillus sp. FJAT-29814 TaxID=1729688 RepID=UPI0008376CB3|nr:serine hydrolase domain-containing protein [Bacillus sp. FJAT-29814]